MTCSIMERSISSVSSDKATVDVPQTPGGRRLVRRSSSRLERRSPVLGGLRRSLKSSLSAHAVASADASGEDDAQRHGENVVEAVLAGQVAPFVVATVHGGSRAAAIMAEGKEIAIRCPCAHLKPAGVTAIAKELKKNGKVRYLDLRQNNLCKDAAKELADGLKQNLALRYFGLPRSCLDADGAIALAAALRSLRSGLKHLDLSGNPLGGAGARALVAALRCHEPSGTERGLQHLNLSNTDLDAESGRALAEALWISRLHSIDVSDNDLPEDVTASIMAATTFPPSVRYCGNSLPDVVAVARQLVLPKTCIKSLPYFMESLARFWDRRGSVTNLIASIHAAIVVTRETRCSSAHVVGCIDTYCPDRLRRLASIYLPQAAAEVQLSDTPVPVQQDELFVLNLSPFRILVGEHSAIEPRVGIHVMAGESSCCLELHVASPDVHLCDWHPNVNISASLKLVPGESRTALQQGDITLAGELRCLFSIKDSATQSGIDNGQQPIARVLTLVWSPPAKLRGVRLSDFTSFWESEWSIRCQRSSHLPASPNMYQANDKLIKPCTAAAQCSLAELLDFGPVETFVSHFWGSPVPDTLLSLSLHAGDNAEKRVWICSLANNQRRLEEELGNDVDKSTFAQALKSGTCGAMALILDQDMGSLTRFWCLYEIMTVITMRQNGFPDFLFDLCTPQGVINRGDAPPEFSVLVGKRLAEIDVEHAQCSNDQDRAMIERAIQERIGGYVTMNEQIRLLVAYGLEIVKERHNEILDAVVDKLRGLRGRKSCQSSMLGNSARCEQDTDEKTSRSLAQVPVADNFFPDADVTPESYAEQSKTSSRASRKNRKAPVSMLPLPGARPPSHPRGGDLRPRHRSSPRCSKSPEASKMTLPDWSPCERSPRPPKAPESTDCSLPPLSQSAMLTRRKSRECRNATCSASPVSAIPRLMAHAAQAAAGPVEEMSRLRESLAQRDCEIDRLKELAESLNSSEAFNKLQAQNDQLSTDVTTLTSELKILRQESKRLKADCANRSGGTWR